MQNDDNAGGSKIEFTTFTASSPSDAGTIHPVLLTIAFSDRNFVQPTENGHLKLGEEHTHKYDTSGNIGSVESVHLRLNGQAPTAPDNWLPVRFKLDMVRNGKREHVFDLQWDKWLDEQHRVHTIYRA